MESANDSRARRALGIAVIAASITAWVGTAAIPAGAGNGCGDRVFQALLNGPLLNECADAGPPPQDLATRDGLGQRLAQNTQFDGWRQYFDTRSHAITADRRGHFVTTAHIDGVALELLVDTGASRVILSPRDARRIGIDVGSLTFTSLFSTAGGVVRTAPIILDEIRIGDFAVSPVRAFVIETPSSVSVLGMDFLSRLERYEVKGRELMLHW